ncbi:TetR/AcrR family transcriptional regulator [Propionibacterium sp. NM47_B9-13]|jgi:AcrR family transcriptional regulator|uniref:TetR family transcriptional regulator n=2 Tax=Cutibacterium modestum TaxID=2559073 RepID=A0AAD1KP69_9ACTN|nr:TetR/AcrR family transcriptional regulator [Cutibacterium modestum]TGY29237.1 TetR/AcrR family transcriptional regulator [Propionibacterium sp. NM47_B9-13]AOH44982.1 TetR family transcriptional regulator [Cutibacterium modestum]EFS75435.1 transcriptional regulator, TetR family [Cutibacterium modestum HL037PA2]EFS91228.1 transcriptional regulator, TetR family [Cutibacterium modestum HL044PA1]EFT16757.1 transcriptional regulator, TetR family [Cutibacterium modestum HL037PA3]
MPAAVERPHRDEVRNRILAAAVQNFERDGYAGASLRRIASDAGFTKGAVYSNFGSKPDLFRQVCAARLASGERDVVDALFPVLSSYGRPDDVMRSISEKLTEILLEDAPWQVILAEFRALARRDEEIAAAYSKLQAQRIAQLVELTTQYGVLDHVESTETANPRSLAVVVLSLVNVLALEFSVASSVIDRQVITDVIERAIRGFLQ